MQFIASNITLTFEKDRYIKFRAYDNVAGRLVIDRLQTHKYITRRNSFLGLDKGNVDYTSHIDRLWQHFDNISALGYKHPFERTDNPTQIDLNKYHRFFTANSVWINNYTFHNIHAENPYDPKFTFDMIPSREQWLDLIHGVNTEVHKLEVGTETNQKSFVASLNPAPYIHLTCNDNNIHDASWKNFDEQDDQLIYQNSLATVLLSDEIQGKSYLRAFLDDDDPREFDVTGREGTYGGIVFDLDDTRQKIYKSPEFQKWVKFYKLDYSKLPLEYAIGEIKQHNWIDDGNICALKTVQIQ